MASTPPANPTPRFSMRSWVLLIRLPNLLILMLGQVLTALCLVKPYASFSALITDRGFLLLLLSTTLITAAGYIINDYYDVKIDLINRPNRVMVGRLLKRRLALLWHSVLNMIAVAIGFLLSYVIGLVQLIATFCLWLYSNQLKRLPFIGNFMVAGLTGMSIALVGIYFNQNQFLVNTYAFFAGGITLIREIIKDMEDREGDAIHGCLTLPIIWGLRKTKILLYILSALFVASLLYMAMVLQMPRLLWFFMALSPVFLWFIYKLYRSDTVKAYGFLSQYLKIMMLTGILSMLLFLF
jgi:4-hydroxybenzoate polyprenyltransferase